MVQITRPCDVLPRLLNDIELDHVAKRNARIQCTKLAKQLEPCTDLMSKTPTSIAVVIICRVRDPSLVEVLVSQVAHSLRSLATWSCRC